MTTTNEQAGINTEEKPPGIVPAVSNELSTVQRVPSRTSINADEKVTTTALADKESTPTQTVINVGENPFETSLPVITVNEPSIVQPKVAETSVHLNEKPLQINPAAAATEPLLPQSTPTTASVTNVVTSPKSVELDPVVIEQASNLNTPASDLFETRFPKKKMTILAVICGTSISLFILGIASIIPLLELIIGWRYADQCPIKRRIPQYLFVAGVASFVVIILSIVLGLLALVSAKKFASSLADEKGKMGGAIGVGAVTVLLSVVNFILTLFCFGWFIAGCIWVFGVWNQVQYKDTTSSTYCHPTLYRFAYWLLLISIFFIVFKFVWNCLQCCKQLSTIKRGGAQRVPTIEP